MAGTTTDPNDPAIRRGPAGGDEAPVPMNEKYLVLSADELAKGYVRPYRESYVHKVCKTETRMGPAIAATYARDPWFYGATYCVNCSKHRPLTEFTWDGRADEMDPRRWSDQEVARVLKLADEQMWNDAALHDKEKSDAKMAD